MRARATLAALLLIVAGVAAAQDNEAGDVLAATTLLVVPAHKVAAVETAETGKLVGYGMLGGTAGFLVGGLTGVALKEALVDCNPDDSFCGFELIFGGAAVVGTFGMALGTHLANGRRGNLAVDYLAGMGIWAGGILLARLSGWHESITLAAFVGIPIAQLAAIASLERSLGGRSVSRSPTARLGVLPHPDGGFVSFGSIPF